jgi:hypothetical protein
MIAYCGLVCTDCDAYLATKANDEKKVAEIVKTWSKEYNTEVKSDDVWCDGCLVGGKKCAHCAKCDIRACAIKEDVENCAHCVDYPCKIVTRFFELAPPARESLDKIKAGL